MQGEIEKFRLTEKGWAMANKIIRAQKIAKAFPKFMRKFVEDVIITFF